MSQKKNCKVCGKFYTSKREDKIFCSDRCAAQWARDEGYHRERFHAEKPEQNFSNCEWCNQKFIFNDYAARGGERQAKFCSNKCRQAAYRARKAAEGQPAGYTGNWDDARNDKRGKGTSQEERYRGYDEAWNRANEEAQRQKQHDKGTSQGNGNKGTSHQNADKGTQQPRWNSKDPYEVLGVLRTSTKEEIKKAWKKLLRTFHPDISKEPNAADICKKINWAWDKIENPNARTNRR